MLWIIITLQHILLSSDAFNACVWFHTVATQTHLPNENWTLPQGKLDSNLLTRDQLCPHSGPTDRAKSRVFFFRCLTVSYYHVSFYPVRLPRLSLIILPFASAHLRHGIYIFKKLLQFLDTEFNNILCLWRKREKVKKKKKTWQKTLLSTKNYISPSLVYSLWSI